jgi:trans-aconitate methyltransferase
MNNKYWKQFYKKNEAPTEHSSFAKFCTKYIKNNNFILDLGCGNGRDTRFLAKYCGVIVGIDKATESEDGDKYFFIKKDFKEAEIIKSRNIDVYYTRFFLHSISNEDILFLLDSVKNGSRLMIECRAKEDNPLIYKNHERNLIDYKWLLSELKERNFKVIFKKKSKGLAKYKEEDPCVIRIIAKKQ